MSVFRRYKSVSVLDYGLSEDKNHVLLILCLRHLALVLEQVLNKCLLKRRFSVLENKENAEA